MKQFLKLWSLNKQNQWILKFGISVLVVGLAFHLLFNQSTRFDPELEAATSSSSSSYITARTYLPVSPPPASLVSPPPDLPVSPPPVEMLETPSDVAVDELPGPPPAPQPSSSSSSAAAAEVSNSTMSVDGRPDPDENEAPDDGKCNLLVGDWVPEPSGPMYTNATCRLMDGHQNCMKNGRPDSGYLYWKWKPRRCELPAFDAQRFLELMRNKSWGVIGDSISRNHAESLLCMLSTVEEAVEVYHDKEFRSKTWKFPTYNFTLANIWAPFLVEAAIFEDYNGVSTKEVQLQLDKLDKSWVDAYPSFDFAIISTGKWFLKAAVYHENNTVVGCHFCPAGKNLTETGFVFAYEKALSFAMSTILQSKHKGQIFFRTSTPDHFQEGEWHNGGTCQQTAPAKEGEFELKEVNKILRKVELAEFEKASAKAAESGVNLKLVDFTNLLLTRPDGHPDAYRNFQPFAKDKNATVQNDCLHWCLPGPIDYLNDVLMEMVPLQRSTDFPHPYKFIRLLLQDPNSESRQNFRSLSPSLSLHFATAPSTAMADVALPSSPIPAKKRNSRKVLKQKKESTSEANVLAQALSETSPAAVLPPPSETDPMKENSEILSSAKKVKGKAARGGKQQQSSSFDKELEQMQEMLQKLTLEKEKTEEMLKEKDEMLRAREEELENKGKEQEKLQAELKKLQKLKEFKPNLNFLILKDNEQDDKDKKKKKKGGAEKKRPSPPYILWYKDQWAEMKKDNPNADFKEVSVILGAKWKTASAEEKKPYQEKYQAEKEVYLQVMAKEKRETEAMKLLEEDQKQKTAMELLEQYLQFKHEADDQGNKKPKKEKDPLKPKQPMSAFFIYTNERRAALVAENKNVTEVAKITGEEWKNMSEKKKAPYEEVAKKNKENYLIEMEAYKLKKEEEASHVKKEEEELLKLHKQEAMQLLKKKEKTENIIKKTKEIKQKKKKDQAADPNKPKKPASSFLLFSKETRKSLMAERPGTNNSTITALISVKWKELSEEERQVWNAKAAEAMDAYKKEMEEYNKSSAAAAAAAGTSA
ncbi:unnamed protein product [Linum tenue]|uniref:HMG box domain-containing protein n=1 Tax=Linum tenue TaxID=586396 RepID=A0AAV0M4S9_9ROSI|nr:unnamed protein product [Linum tenue]